MMLAPDGPSALPLWINGHAFLTATKSFHTVINPNNGLALRLVPLCGADELRIATDSATAASPDWLARTEQSRIAFLKASAELLEKYAPHFAKILHEETGIEASTANNEVAEACSRLKSIEPTAPTSTSIAQVVITDASQPFSIPIGLIGKALAAGQCVILKPSVKAPSALFAFVELTGRLELPAGVLSLVHGDDHMITAIADAESLHDIAFAGQAQLAEKIQAQMNHRQKSLVLA